ncbi:hypothetical protein B1A90_00970 [Neisseria meningitidis]|nr:hypothetical protein B1A91_10840 [Neisseria meningitidis]OOG96774.1 hypothetical protein B1A92_08175 [Neisseria meningitidis]OOH00752.1 hypothetical protein B1A90_00970 [Neisseria meningitidis]RNK19168.1 hypothetical protein COI20_06185 [Neisseria meningitidis]
MHKQVQHITTKLFYFKITDISFFIDFKFHIFNILGILFQRKRNRLIKTIPTIHSDKTARNIRFPISTTIRYRTPRCRFRLHIRQNFIRKENVENKKN